MTFILSFIISAILFIAVNATPVGKYFSELGTTGGILIYINEDSDVYVVYKCSTGITFGAGPYSLRSRPGGYTIVDDSCSEESLLDLMRERCPEWLLLGGDLRELSFASDEKSLRTSLRGESVSFLRVDNRFLTLYYSTYLDLEVNAYVSEHGVVEVKVRCGLPVAGAVLKFKPDERSDVLSEYVLAPEGFKSYDTFKRRLSDLCGFELSPGDFETMAFVTPTTAYTQLGGRRLTLTAI
ncbi:hypothetical protein FOZ63_022870 [Perkinsus olseni]|uniref:Uncharacterized protein n=1 Tax=Perkinsus olseni TaxID=32597 RepID=A0A7J6RCQ4_PEROL|nr:hypothetical protein FOZ63_022870 [Perkinsus olseni]